MAKEILFLCGHNAGRSQMAQAFFNNFNKNKEYVGISAGTNAVDKVNPFCVKAMKEIDIDMSDKDLYYPKKVNNETLLGAYKIFTMGCGVVCKLPAGKKFDADWNLDDPAGKSIKEVSRIKEELKKKILDLIKDLNQEKK